MSRNLKLILATCTSCVALSTVAQAQDLPAAAPAADARSAPAQPQENPPSATASNEPAKDDIIITARGRTEKLQNAPIAVTAFSDQALNDARIKDVADFIAITPNVSIVKSQSVGNSFITIRGVSQVRNGESPVSVVVDGVQQISARQFTADLFDVQQIEVLRGPQGALYGRNAIGGAMIITTKQPTNDFRENFDATIGNGGDYHFEASVAGPIVKDKLLFRVAGNFHDFGGLLENVYLNSKVDFAHDRTISGQLKAYFTPNFTADLRANYDYSYGGVDNFQYQSAKFASPGSCFLDPANPFGGPLPDANRVSRTFCANNLGRNQRKLTNVSLRMQLDTSWGSITNTASYIRVIETIESDQFPYTASRNVFGTDGTQTGWEDRNALQNDFRIASKDTGRLKWMAGAYILRTNYDFTNTTGLDNGTGVLPVRRQPLPSTSTNPTLSFLADRNKNLAYAFYGDLSYELTDGLVADFGYRYDHDQRRHIVNPLTFPVGLPAGCTTTSGEGPCTLSHNFAQSQPKFTLSYKASPDFMLFADYGVGFRSGQYNQYGVGQAAAAATPPILGVSDLVKAEVAKTAEAGFKASFLNGKLRLNATGFYTRDENPFYFLFVGSVGAQILVNIDQVDLYGLEIEANLTPVKGLDLSANYGFTNSRIAKFAFNPADVGNRAPYIPEQSGSVAVQFRTPIAGDVGFVSRAQVEYHGKQYWDPENSTPRNAFALVNLQAGIEKLGGSWSLVAFVNNVADKAYNAEFVNGGFVQPAPPRTFGLELKGSF